MLIGKIVFKGQNRTKRLKKYLNPHENSCSKVISLLITGNILHESSSAPQQHKSKWFALYLHRHVSHTDMLQPHLVSCRGRQHARIQKSLSVLFIPQLILQFTEGIQWFYCCEKYTYTLPRIKRGSIIFHGGGVGVGVSNFFQGRGPNDKLYINPYTYLLFSRGGVSGDTRYECWSTLLLK